MTTCGAKIDGHPCKCKISEREAKLYQGACQECFKTLEAQGNRRYALKDGKKLVNAILDLMESMTGEYGSILSDFDRVEMADVSQDLPALKKYVGQRLDPMEKARLILTAAAYQNFKRGENTLENLCQPLANYPELSVPPDCIALNLKTTIKVKVLFFKAPGESEIRINSQRVWDYQRKITPGYCYTRNVLQTI